MILLMKNKFLPIFLALIALGCCQSNAGENIAIDASSDMRIFGPLEQKPSSVYAEISIDIRAGCLFYTIKNQGNHDSQLSTSPIMNYDDFRMLFSCDDTTIPDKRVFKVSMRAKWDELTFPKTEKIQRFRNLLLFRNEFLCKSAPIWKFTFWDKEGFSENSTKHLEYNVTSSIRTTETDGTGKASPLIINSSTVLLKRQIGSLLALQRKAAQDENEAVVPFPMIPAKPSARLLLDKSTGHITITISNEANIQEFHEVCPVRMNVGAHFGNSQQEDVFFSRFYASSNTHKIDAPSIQFSEEDRIFDLDGNESVGKECKIWELAIWPQLVDAMKANRSEKFTIRYPVCVELIGKFDNVPLNEEGFSIVPHEETAELTIDYRTMIQMEKLREASSTE